MRYTEQQSLTQIRFVQFTGLWATDRFHVKACQGISILGTTARILVGMKENISALTIRPTTPPPPPPPPESKLYWSAPFPLAYACHAKNVQGLILCNINDFVSS